MSNAIAVNDNAKSGLQKMAGFGIMAVSVIEAVLCYLLILYPLFIKPVFAQAKEFTDSGTTTIVRIFGKLFVSEQYITDNNIQIVLSLFGVVFNIAVILVVFYAAQFIISFFFLKGSAFANSFFLAAFGIKFIVSIGAFIVPFANVRNSMRAFAGVDAVINLLLFCFFLYISLQDTIAEQLLTVADVDGMKKRAYKSGIFFVLSTVVLFLQGFTTSCFGSNYSLFLGWNDTGIIAGFAMIAIYGVAFLACISYVKDNDWALVFFGVFGVIIAVVDILGLVGRVQWLLRYFKYKKMTDDADAVAWLETNRLTMGWGVNTGLMVGAVAILVVIAVMAILAIKKNYKKTVIDNEAEKQSRIIVNCSSLLLLGAAALSLGSSYLYLKTQFGVFQSGSFDFIYLAVYCGLSGMIGISLFKGYSWARWGVIAVSVCSFILSVSTALGILSTRSSVVAAKLAEGIRYTGINYIISFVLLILAMLIWAALVAGMLAFKNVPDYLYKKRYE